MTAIHLRGLSKHFGETAALSDVTLDLQAGTFNALLGPSGCGKTTILRLIAGFEAPSAGEVRFDDRVIATPQAQTPPEARGVGVVFQSYALWPHMDVGANVAYPLKRQGVTAADIDRKVRDVLATVGLSGFERRGIDALSGGQRQRVALARCLVAGSNIILFDEPLANLDMHLRASMVEVFRDVHRRSGATIVYVTHDQTEALALADRVAVMQGGRVRQFAAPELVYARPADEVVARFVGRGGVIAGVRRDDGMVEAGGYRFAARSADQATGPVNILLRPEHLSLSDSGLPASVTNCTYRGPVHELWLSIDGLDEQVIVEHNQAVSPGTPVNVAVTDAWVIPG